MWRRSGGQRLIFTASHVCQKSGLRFEPPGKERQFYSLREHHKPIILGQRLLRGMPSYSPQETELSWAKNNLSWGLRSAPWSQFHASGQEREESTGAQQSPHPLHYFSLRGEKTKPHLCLPTKNSCLFLSRSWV